MIKFYPRKMDYSFPKDNPLTGSYCQLQNSLQVQHSMKACIRKQKHIFIWHFKSGFLRIITGEKFKQGKNTKEEKTILKTYAVVYEKGGRSKNEDSVLLHVVHTAKGEALLAAVCDGIGGLQQGEEASGYLAEQLLKWFYQDFMKRFQSGCQRKYIKNSLTRLFRRVHKELKCRSRKDKIHMGTTVSGILQYGNCCFMFQIGDSEVWKINSRGGLRLTNIQADDKGYLKACIGTGEFCKPYYKDILFLRKKGFLIMSDGLSHTIQPQEFAGLYRKNISRKEEELPRGLRELAGRALKRGEKDNISAVYIQF